MPVPLIDPRAYDALVRFINEFNLATHDPRIAGMLRTINIDHPTTIDVHAFESLRSAVAIFHPFHEQYPFPIAPAGSIDTGTITIGKQVGNGSKVTLSGRQVEHVLVCAPTGAGKSHLLAHIIEALLQ